MDWFCVRVSVRVVTWLRVMSMVWTRARACVTIRARLGLELGLVLGVG